MFKLHQLKIREQSLLVQAAELNLIEQKLMFLPSRSFPIMVHRDGSKWVCSFGFHPDPTFHVVAYGESPAQACTNFDALWAGTGVALEEEDEGEEEY